MPLDAAGSITVEIDWGADGFAVGTIGVGPAFTDTFADTFADTFGVAPAAEELAYSDTYGDAYGVPYVTDSTVTPYVRPQVQPITCEYGRDQTSALSPTVAGRAGLALDNRTRIFSPRNAASPLYGKLKPARPVRITRTIDDGGTVGDPVYPATYGATYAAGPEAPSAPAEYRLFYGHTDDSPLNPDLDSLTVSVSMLDYLADFRGQTITTALHRDIRTGTAIGLVLDACGWSADLRDIDVGATIIPWWWEDGTDAMSAIEKIVQSEGPPALITQGSSGEIIFRDRHHRLTRARSLNVQGTWRASGNEQPVMHRGGFAYDEAWSHIVNTGSASVEVRQPGPLDVIWSAGDDVTIALAAGEQRILTAASENPFQAAVTPELGVDYRLLAGGGGVGSVTVRLIKPSGTSTGIELTAGGSGAVLTGLQVRGYPLTVAYTINVSANDSTSVAEYGQRSFPGELPWCSVYDAQAILDLAVSMRAQPLPQVQTRFMIGGVPNVAKAEMLLARDLSDRVTVIEPETALENDFYVESIRHELTGVHDHTITFGLEAAAAPSVLTSVNSFRFDTAGSGFDQGRFGSGLDRSLTLFRFDVAGQGFDSGGFGI